MRAAQAGDAGCLGLLLARHRAGMHAVALALLGHGPDAEDAVQEAALIALRRIGDVRDPDAVGPWLRMVVRNVCRAQLRRMSAVPVAEPAEAVAMDRSDGPPDPAEVLDRHALRDWVWSALEDLSPGLRLVTMLRYFTDVTSYEDIAALCATPVGTVRSRLNQARAKLADALLDSADRAHDDAAALTALHRRLAEETMVSAHRGELASALSDRWSPQADVTWPTGKRTGIDYLGAAFDRDMSDGVRHELLNVVASREVVIWEAALHSPPEDPFHCPPGVVWVHFLDQGRVSRCACTTRAAAEQIRRTDPDEPIELSRPSPHRAGMNATNHRSRAPGGPRDRRWARRGPSSSRACARSTGSRVRGPVCLVHSGGPGVHPEYLRMPALEQQADPGLPGPGRFRRQRPAAGRGLLHVPLRALRRGRTRRHRRPDRILPRPLARRLRRPPVRHRPPRTASTG